MFEFLLLPQAARACARLGLGRALAPALAALAALWLLAAVCSAQESAPTPPPPGMILVPAGWFQMGSDRDAADEAPAHRVYLDAFYLDRHEVTNAQFAAFMQTAGYDADDKRMAWANFGVEHDGKRFRAKAGREDWPVVRVEWREADRYCRSLGKTLPTEAQWEKAARGGLEGRRFPRGDSLEEGEANVHRWWDPHPDPVGSHPANGYGFQDMAGNVSEFCDDFYRGDFYRISPEKNPRDEFNDSFWRRSVRGGAFSLPVRMARVSKRFFMTQNDRESNDYTGFRCACAASGPARGSR